MNTAQSNITKRLAAERGRADHGWLQARFTFSFANYVDPDHMGFKSLRVMNNDTIQPGGGFPMHPHEDMEIFTYVIEGQLEHTDSMGNRAVIEAGNLQYMSAGSGVIHSEFNPSQTEHTLLYQIWLLPSQRGGNPRYVEKALHDRVGLNMLLPLFSGDGRNGSTEIHQNAEISFARLQAGHTVSVDASETMPHLWIQAIKGMLHVGAESLSTGDGLAIENHAGALDIAATKDSECLVFRLS
jgi:redox-sensitive bicupin YhaK (pirin superfamily)